MASNAAAHENSMRFATGDVDLLALVGPTGWGKTTLLGAMRQRLTRRGTDASAIVLTASDWIHRSGRLEPGASLLLDNVQEVLDAPRVRQTFLMALERRVRLGRPTALCFTSPKVTRQFRGVLPGSRSWTIATIASPTTAERADFVRHVAPFLEMRLNEPLIQHIAQTMLGNGRTICGALNRLRMRQSEWLDDESTVRALGLLSPFCADCADWDLRELIADASTTLGLRDDPCRRKAMLAYTMLNIALLPETEVARFLGVIPGAAYGLSVQCQSDMASNPQAREEMRLFLANVIGALSR
jgi:energy-coupling factor transporter ATP-binding protein EcfA2